MKKTVKKTIFSLIAFAGFSSALLAQNSSVNSDVLGRIALTPYVSEEIENMPQAALSVLQNKLNQISSANGVAGNGYDSRFIITANTNILTKDIVAGAPVMTALTLDVTLYIGDGIDGKKFASQSLTLKGVGTNETKAYIEALKAIKPESTALQSFVASGKSKIINYYNAKCDQIIKEAQNLDKMNMPEEAIYKLTSVPEDCTECYNKVMTAIVPIFKKKIDRDCKLKLAEANSIWNAGQDLDAANTAGEILASIDPQASCIKEAKELSNKIGKRVYELDKREWNYKMETDVNLKRDLIKAYRDIGVAYGNGQPKTVTYNVHGWW